MTEWIAVESKCFAMLWVSACVNEWWLEITAWMPTQKRTKKKHKFVVRLTQSSATRRRTKNAQPLMATVWSKCSISMRSLPLVSSIFVSISKTKSWTIWIRRCSCALCFSGSPLRWIQQMKSAKFQFLLPVISSFQRNRSVFLFDFSLHFPLPFGSFRFLRKPQLPLCTDRHTQSRVADANFLYLIQFLCESISFKSTSTCPICPMPFASRMNSTIHYGFSSFSSFIIYRFGPLALVRL